MWHCRREPTILRSADGIGFSTSDGIPFLALESVLLLKSRTTGGKERSKDQRDFERAVRHLDPERRAWLRWALIASTPSHPLMA